MTAPLPTIAGLSDLAGRYDAVLSDVWGVIHNGVSAIPEAVEALRSFRKAGGRAVLITNAPRPSVPSSPCSIASASRATPMTPSSPRRRHPRHDRQVSRPRHPSRRPAHRGRRLYEGLDSAAPAPRRPRSSSSPISIPTTTHPKCTASVPPLALAQAPHDLRQSRPRGRAWRQIIYCGGAWAISIRPWAAWSTWPASPIRPSTRKPSASRGRRGRSLDKSRVLAIGDSVRTDAVGAAQFRHRSSLRHRLDPRRRARCLRQADPQAIADLIAPSRARVAG